MAGANVSPIILLKLTAAGEMTFDFRISNILKPKSHHGKLTKKKGIKPDKSMEEMIEGYCQINRKVFVFFYYVSIQIDIKM